MILNQRKKIGIIVLLVLDIPLTILILFVINGMILANNEKPIAVKTENPAATISDPKNIEVKVMSYNIAKLFAHNGGLSFKKPQEVRVRLKQIADLIIAEKPDFVFLSEAISECTPCPVNQIEEIAQASGMYVWAFGENYNFGLPFYRIVGGNAILSRWHLEPVANISLKGRQPFYVTKNNRRALWCEAQIGDRKILLASLHNDSYSRKNNLAQVQQLFEYMGNREAVWAGDFNASPGEPPIDFLRKSGKFQ